MAEMYSDAYGDVLSGNVENDRITVAGIRSQVFGNGGNDSIDALNCLITADGGRGNDTLTAARSYITLDGGAGADTFLFLPKASKIYSAIVSDFDAEEGDVVIIGSDNGTVLVDEADENTPGSVVRGILCLCGRRLALHHRRRRRGDGCFSSFVSRQRHFGLQSDIPRRYGCRRDRECRSGLCRLQRRSDEQSSTRRASSARRLIDKSQRLDCSR